MRSSLTSSDGAKYVCDGDDITGIRAINANPARLTEIQPKGRIITSFTFRIPSLDRGAGDRVTSFRLQMEIVVNQNFSENQYANYQSVVDQLPPYCKIHNFVLDIPVK